MGSKIDKEGARYRARLDKTLTDGKVTPQEADALIKDAKNGHFSEVEAHYLSGFVDRKQRSFDPAARSKLVAFVSGEMESLAKIAGDTGLADHAYTLLGVEEKNGQKMVSLRNPWGEREPGHDGKDDGIFLMPLEKFMTSFATVEFAKP